MDPVSVGLLAALAGGAGGEMGRQAWASLSDLVRRPLGRSLGDAQPPVVSSGEAELTALSEEPSDPARTQALSAALTERAAADEDFHADLQQWHERAKLVRTGNGEVHNTISGGHYGGPVLQGRDFSGTSFTTAPPSAPASGDNTPPPQG
ncbi:hypothetical protein DMH26_01990 [Streptomyces sp. WAC 05379]|nr:hypothetical protein DMH26_01990 [Streptomyces sp. WAC 05379]